jgi:nucleotide-binding universal stress UspA family protein
MTEPLLSRVVVPVADPEDANRTAAALKAADPPGGGEIKVVYVVEKAGGAPDKASVEQREEYARELFGLFRDAFDGDHSSIETEILYGTDIAAAVETAAREIDATAIVFTPRGGSRWVKLLTGDIASDLVTNSDIPVIALPEETDE